MPAGLDGLIVRLEAACGVFGDIYLSILLYQADLLNNIIVS